MFKSLFLPLILVAAFIVLVGVFFKNPSSLKLFASPTPAGKKSITVGDADILVTLADDDSERVKGLSGTKSLGEREGMLFIFDKKDIQTSFWMKDMVIPIDIIWINDGKVARIDKNVPAPASGTPDSKLPLYRSGTPIDYVLEVGAGFSDKNGLKAGDNVDIP